MSRDNPKISKTLGFLSAVNDGGSARIGGLLTINASGRPLEFHCTAPVKPNRAQEILYGPTLEEYLCGEQIGHTLYEAVKDPPILLLTDVAEMLSLRQLIRLPLIFITAVCTDPAGSGAAKDAGESQLVSIKHRGIVLATRHEHEGDLPQASEIIESLAGSLDLQEPFKRIHEAIQEAQGGVRKQTAA